VTFPTRTELKIGLHVKIESKTDQGTGKLTEGIIENILTPGNSHPYGIMVQLTNGIRGRVKEKAPFQEKKLKISSQTIPQNEVVQIDIPKNEDKQNEFKSTLKFDLKRFQEGDGVKTGNRTVLKEIPITIAGFANNIGGILFIGVDDNGLPLGLDNDFEMLGGRDKFEQEITNALRDIENMTFVSHLSILFQEKDEKTVCIIQVPQSKKPIYVKNNEINELYVRVNNTTKKFDGKDLADYLEEHFSSNG